MSVDFNGITYGFFTTENGDHHFGIIEMGAYAHLIELYERKNYNSADGMEMGLLFIH